EAEDLDAGRTITFDALYLEADACVKLSVERGGVVQTREMRLERPLGGVKGVLTVGAQNTGERNGDCGFELLELTIEAPERGLVIDAAATPPSLAETSKAALAWAFAEPAAALPRLEALAQAATTPEGQRRARFFAALAQAELGRPEEAATVLA